MGAGAGGPGGEAVLLLQRDGEGHLRGGGRRLRRRSSSGCRRLREDRLRPRRTTPC